MPSCFNSTPTLSPDPGGFMTYGDIPAAEIRPSDEVIFNSVTERKEPAFPRLAKATGSIERTIQVPVQGDDSEMHALQATWLLAPSTDIEELVKAEVLSAILMSRLHQLPHQPCPRAPALAQPGAFWASAILKCK